MAVGHVEVASFCLVPWDVEARWKMVGHRRRRLRSDRPLEVVISENGTRAVPPDSKVQVACTRFAFTNGMPRLMRIITLTKPSSNTQFHGCLRHCFVRAEFRDVNSLVTSPAQLCGRSCRCSGIWGSLLKGEPGLGRWKIVHSRFFLTGKNKGDLSRTLGVF